MHCIHIISLLFSIYNTDTGSSGKNS